MSLNPSNAIAQRANPEKRVFPNLACRLPIHEADPELFGKIDAACRAELEAAGIKVESYEIFRVIPGGGAYREVPTQHVGTLCQWTFRRNWYYWVCEGPGVPPDIAQEFHQTWGTQCRTNGDCTCPSPLFQNHGFGIGDYHIDTAEGLKAFAELLQKIYRPTLDWPNSAGTWCCDKLPDPVKVSGRDLLFWVVHPVHLSWVRKGDFTTDYGEAKFVKIRD